MPDDKAASFQKKLSDIQREGEEREAERIAQATGHPYVDLRTTPVSIEAVKLIAEEDAKKAKVIAMQLKVHELAVAAVDPADPAVTDVVRKLESEHFTVKLFVASLSGVLQAWHFYQFVSKKGEAITGAVEIGKDRLKALTSSLTNLASVTGEFGKIDFQTLSVIETLEVMFAGALANRASDIHMEAGEGYTTIRFRVDGVLHTIFDKLPNRNYDALLSRLKLLSELKINVRTEPQDGRFSIELDGKEIEMRVSIIPSEFGETVVMRILDPSSIQVDLSELGLRSDDRAIVDAELKKPNGLLLNTGPTGSGKTTTLYAFLRGVASPEVKVITVEDPIEYRLGGVEQTQVDPDAGYTFASGLRSILRQDPDVILVGEIRDAETADIALQAALTGHLVFSTLHTNDAVGAVPRLMDLGVKSSTIAPALSLVIAQRLVRRLCAQCRASEEVPAALREKLERFLRALPSRVDKDAYKEFALHRPVGCASCSGIGYRGRIGVFEFLQATEDVQEAVGRGASEMDLRKLGRAQGMVTMQEDGILKAIRGETTLEEVEKATGTLKWESP